MIVRKRRAPKAVLRPFKSRQRGFDDLRTTRSASLRMGLVRQHGTRPELIVRKIATLLGLRYRTHNKDLSGSPDLANRTRRFAVQVMGCFWHRHRACPKSTIPKVNRAFWLQKFQANQKRDVATRRALRRAGFQTIVIWECETRNPEIVERRLKSLSGETSLRRRSEILHSQALPRPQQ
jgi:DNA mismatch endonuclease (patch repair protein)